MDKRKVLAKKIDQEAYYRQMYEKEHSPHKAFRQVGKKAMSMLEHWFCSLEIGRASCRERV